MTWKFVTVFVFFSFLILGETASFAATMPDLKLCLKSLVDIARKKFNGSESCPDCHPELVKKISMRVSQDREGSAVGLNLNFISSEILSFEEIHNLQALAKKQGLEFIPALSTQSVVSAPGSAKSRTLITVTVRGDLKNIENFVGEVHVKNLSLNSYEIFHGEESHPEPQFLDLPFPDLAAQIPVLNRIMKVAQTRPVVVLDPAHNTQIVFMNLQTWTNLRAEGRLQRNRTEEIPAVRFLKNWNQYYQRLTLDLKYLLTLKDGLGQVAYGIPYAEFAKFTSVPDELKHVNEALVSMEKKDESIPVSNPVLTTVSIAQNPVDLSLFKSKGKSAPVEIQNTPQVRDIFSQKVKAFPLVGVLDYYKELFLEKGSFPLSQSQPYFQVSEKGKVQYVAFLSSWAKTVPLNSLYAAYHHCADLKFTEGISDQVLGFFKSFRATSLKDLSRSFKVVPLENLDEKIVDAAVEKGEPLVLNANAFSLFLVPVDVEFKVVEEPLPVEKLENSESPLSEEHFFASLDLIEELIRKGELGSASDHANLQIFERRLRINENLNMAKELLGPVVSKASLDAYTQLLTSESSRRNPNAALLEKILKRLRNGNGIQESVKVEEFARFRQAVINSLPQERRMQVSDRIIFLPQVSKDVEALGSDGIKSFSHALVKLLDGSGVTKRISNTFTGNVMRAGSGAGEFRVVYEVMPTNTIVILYVFRRNENYRKKTRTIIDARFFNLQESIFK